MTYASSAAKEISSRYFSAKGEIPPDDQAKQFLKRIHICPDTGQWRSLTLVDTAAAILAAATIDVDDLVENFLGCRLSIEPLSEFDSRAGAQVFGIAYPKEQEIVICERAEQYAPLYRTCVAHEIGHLVLHRGPRNDRRLNYAPESRIRPPEEMEADEFMIELLAPINILKLALAFAAHQSDLHIGALLQEANSFWGRDHWQHAMFPALIDRMCLSRHFFSVQLQKLGLFSFETAAFHKTYKLPNRWRRPHSE